MSRSWVWAFVFLFASLATVGGARAKDEAAAPCGAPGKPPCPLQHWMRVNAAAPLALGRWDELEKSFTKMIELNPSPDKWGNWNRIAKEGASAARERREGAAREACGRCHRAYRRAYNFHHRLRAVEDR